MDYPCDQIGKRERQRADLFRGGLVTLHAPQCVLQMAQEGLRRFGKDLVFFQMMQADASTGGKGIETKVSPSVLVSLSRHRAYPSPSSIACSWVDQRVGRGR